MPPRFIPTFLLFMLFCRNKFKKIQKRQFHIGNFLFDTIGTVILELYNYNEEFKEINNFYEQYGIWLVLGGGFTPFPYKLITIASGVFGLNIPLFILASIISRGGRFFIVALLLWYFGPLSKKFIEKHLGKLTIIFFLLFLVSFGLIKLL